MANITGKYNLEFQGYIQSTMYGQISGRTYLDFAIDRENIENDFQIDLPREFKY